MLIHFLQHLPLLSELNTMQNSLSSQWLVAYISAEAAAAAVVQRCILCHSVPRPKAALKSSWASGWHNKTGGSCPEDGKDSLTQVKLQLARRGALECFAAGTDVCLLHIGMALLCQGSHAQSTNQDPVCNESKPTMHVQL